MTRRIVAQALVVALVVAALGGASAANPSPASAQPGVLFSFAQISDSQPPNATEWARFEQVLDTLVASGQSGALLPHPVKFVMFAGDLVSSATNTSSWVQWVNTMNAKLTTNGIPYRAVPGNHDRATTIGFANYEAYVAPTAVWDSGLATVTGQNGITVNTGWQGIRFIGLNNSNMSGNTVSATDVAAVNARVSAASAAGENAMLMQHHKHDEGGNIPLATALANPDVVGLMRGHTGSPSATKGLAGVSNPNVWEIGSNSIVNKGGLVYYEVHQTQLVVYPIQLTLNSTSLPTPKVISLPHALTPAGPPGSPNAAFSGLPLSGTAPLAVTFTDQSSGSPTSWSWNFGDSTTSTTQSPTHTYTSPGVYTVSLTATNGSGSDTATKIGYVTVTDPGGGGGGLVSFAGSVTGGSTGSATVTSDPVTVAAGRLYVAAVSTKNHQPVTSVSGLGGTWTMKAVRCGGRSQTGVSVFVSANATTSGTVTATLAGSTTSAAIAVTGYSGVNLADPIGAVNSANTNGVGGACSGGTDSSAYSMPLTTTASSSLVVGAVAVRNRTNSPATGWTQRVESQAGSGGNMAGVAVVDRQVAVPSAITVAGSISGSVDWAVAAIELKSGTSGPPPPTPDVSVSPTSLGFGSVVVGSAAASLNVTVTNLATATADLSISSIGLTSGAPVFAVTAGGVSGTPVSLAPGASRTVTVTFTPAAATSYTGNLRISTNDPDTPTVDVPLSGSGTSGGGGGQVTFEGIVTGGSQSVASVSSGSVAVTAGRVYVATISTKSDQTVTGVSGLGGTWTLKGATCAGRSQTGVSVFVSTNATSSGTVTATLAGAVSAAVISVAGYSGVKLSDPVGAVGFANSNGSGAAAACSGGTDATSYSMSLTTTASSSLVIGALALRNRAHTPGAGWTERVEIQEGSTAGAMAGLAVVDRAIASPGAVSVAGTFSGLLDWALVAIELKAS